VGEKMFGPYRLESLIGRGGMGEVHRAYDTVKDRTVALKLLPVGLASDKGFPARFRRESRVAARLREPHVIPIHDFGEIDGQLFIDMRMVDGVDLATVLEQAGPLEPARAVHIVGQVAAALDAAHAENLIHRDVKPSNVLVAGSGVDEFAYLIDFGIARNLLGTSTTGATVGTLAYMAPERFLHAEGGDARIDVYALGCLLYELLTGQRPFPGDEVAPVMYAHLNAPPPRPSAVRQAVAPGFDAVVAQGMAKEPDHRFRSAGELAAAARAVLATMPTTATPPVPAGVRRPAPTAIAAAASPGGPEPAAGHGHAPAAARSAGRPSPAPTVPDDRLAARPGRRRSAVIAVAVVALGGVIAVVLALINSIGGAAATYIDPAALGTIPVGSSPYGVAVTPDGAHALATNYESDAVSVIDLATQRVVTTVPVGDSPSMVAVTPDGAHALVTNRASGTVSVIEMATHRVVTTVPVGSSPRAVAVTPDGTNVLATNFDSDTVSVIEMATRRVVTTIPAGDGPYGVAVTSDGARALVANYDSDTVSVIEMATHREITTIPVGTDPVAVAVSLDGTRALATNAGSATVSVIDLATYRVTTTIPVGSTPIGVAVTPDGARALATNAGSATVSVIDLATQRVITDIPVGYGPVGVAVTPDGARALATNRDSGTVSVLDTGRREAPAGGN
jgi:serine/threonine-protein kinase